MRDSAGDLHRAAVTNAQDALDRHVKGCLDCSKAKSARQPRWMCRDGWGMFRDRMTAQRLAQDYEHQQRQLAQSQATLPLFG